MLKSELRFTFATAFKKGTNENGRDNNSVTINITFVSLARESLMNLFKL